MNRDFNYQYVNFNNTFAIRPRQVEFPKTLEELQSVVLQVGEEAKQDGRPLKIGTSGSYHVFNDMSISQDIMIRTDNLDRILKIDNEKKVVQVEAGCILFTLIKTLAEHGLALDTVPAISGQSIVGSLSTGTHGSNFQNGSLASSLLSLQVVLANGSLLEIGKLESKELFMALSVSLGTLGVIYSVSLQCRDLYRIREIPLSISASKTSWFEFRDFLSCLPNILLDHPYTQLSVEYPSGEVSISLRSLSESKDSERTERTERTEKRETKQSEIKQKGCNFLENQENQGTIGRYDSVLTQPASDRQSGYTEIEMAFEFNPQTLFGIFEDIFKLRDRFVGKSLVSPNMLVRFAAEDKNSYLSMASDHQHTVYISFFADSKDLFKPGVWDVFRAYHDFMIEKYKARPHFGKIHFLTFAQMNRIYPRFSDFLEVKKWLDPNNIFSNDYSRRLFSA